MAKNLAVYRETLEAAGSAFGPAKLKIGRPVYLADTRQEAWDSTAERLTWFVETQHRAVTSANNRWDLIPEDYHDQAANFQRETFNQRPGAIAAGGRPADPPQQRPTDPNQR